jgi:cyclophilin family peptidyl-prolyl cis-trans isomerase
MCPLTILEVPMRTGRSFLACVLALALGATGAAAGPGVTPAAKKAMRDASNPVVLMTTTLGDVTIELFKKEAPKTVDNFLAYTKSKHYDGTIFHRVIPNFMIQGGGFDKDMKQKETMPPIVNEGSNGIANSLGTIAMARTNDPNSATSQFFINVKDNKFLDSSAGKPGYAVFGKVIDGMDVVNQIKDVKTTTKPPYENVPVVPVVIKSVTVLQ